ncbi:MAG: hypothetical protein K0R10_2165 [Alphaproteobacteria bacterium]|jgi:hypothetical protein|nr:hypothetical protein [Alphaproteobacteria bacterium]
MAKLMRNVLLLAKLESVVGTDPVPTAPLNSMLARAITPQPVVAEFAERTNIRPYFGTGGQVAVAQHSECELEIELASSGVAGTAPAWGPLLQACSFSETVTASTDVKYAPVTNNPKTATLYYYLDGVLHKMTNSRGNVAFELNAKSIPVMRFKFTGLYTAATDTPLPTGADYTGFKAPLAVNKVNTPSMTLHGVSAAMQSLSIDMGNQIVYRNLIGSESVIMTDRKPNGQTSIEMVPVASYAWHEAVRLGTLDAFSVVHGVSAGSIVQIDAPKVQLTNPQYADSDGIAMINLGLDLQPDTGNDEIIITVK